MYEILSNRAVICVSGRDAQSFLQNLTTNDLNNQSYCYSYILNNQGRYLFDFFICKVNDAYFLIDFTKSHIDKFLSRLSLYKLRADVSFQDLSDQYRVIYSRQPLDDKIRSDKHIITTNQDARYSKLGYRSIVHWSKDFSPIITNDITHNMYLEDKYSFAIPDGDLDLVFEKSIPIEYGGQELNAISYSKGCYIGQEVISRAKHYGVIRKKIFKIIATNDFSKINQNDEITMEGNKIGIYCSGYKNIGIALIREDLYNNDKNIKIKDTIIQILFPEWRK